MKRNQRQGKRKENRTVIPSQIFGIEIRDFRRNRPLGIDHCWYQCDVLHGSDSGLSGRGRRWITEVDIFQNSAPERSLFRPRKTQIDFENEGGETYICGNPPYLGSRRQGKSHKEDLRLIASSYEKKWRSLDYVSAWIFLAHSYQKNRKGAFAFVTTSSLNEGLHVSLLWKHIINKGSRIFFAIRPFKWRNLAVKTLVFR